MSDSKALGKVRDPRTFRVGEARSEIWVITDDDQVRRIMAGEKIPLRERKVRRFATGERITCGMPASSANQLVKAGWIVEDKPAPPAPAPKADKGDGAPDLPPSKPDKAPAPKGGDR